jgi:hypothetical protein
VTWLVRRDVWGAACIAGAPPELSRAYKSGSVLLRCLPQLLYQWHGVQRLEFEGLAAGLRLAVCYQPQCWRVITCMFCVEVVALQTPVVASQSVRRAAR